MSGTHNFTIRTISFIETVLGEDVIVVKKYRRFVDGYGMSAAERSMLLNEGSSVKYLKK